MSADPRAALSTLVSALERHLEAAASRRGDDDPAVLRAYQEVADAFDEYDEALLDAYDEVTPLEVYSNEDDDEFDDDDIEDDDDLDDSEEVEDTDVDDDHAGAAYHGIADDDIDYED